MKVKPKRKRGSSGSGKGIGLELLNAVNHGILITDVRGHILYWNIACKKLLGYSKEEMIGKPVKLLYGDEDEMPFYSIMEKLQKSSSVSGRWHARHKSGQKVCLDTRAGIYQAMGKDGDWIVISLCNLDRLELAEKELKAKEAFATTILETSADAIITANERGLIISANPAAGSLFGYEADEMLGMHAKRLIPGICGSSEDEVVEDYLNDSECMESGKVTEMQGEKRDGTLFPLHLSVGKVAWNGGHFYAGIIRDLTKKRELENKILEIGNEERRRVGQELHDGLGQMLTGIRMISENLARKLENEKEPAAEDVREISDMVNDADEYARTLSRGMVQVEFEKQGLAIATQNLAERVEKLTGIRCEFHDEADVEIENYNTALNVYRIIQEAVNNAVRHSGANRIDIRIQPNPESVEITVEDNGKGFDPSSEREKGSGIEIMKYRTDLMGGIFEINRTAEDRTRVRCVISNQ
ncbi:MAG: PAS domain S-box protein [Bacteroidetes bacterium]|jgi:PAS domain S-box-containing protein|nr:PAS domain S-box protein [Bacteroidota bacterium]